MAGEDIREHANPEQELGLNTSLVSEIVEFARRHADSHLSALSALRRLESLSETVISSASDHDFKEFVAAYNEIEEIAEKARAF